MSDYNTPPPPPPPPPPPGGFQQQGPVSPWGAPLAPWIQRVGAYLLDQCLILPFALLQFVFLPKTVTTDINGTINTTTSAGNLLLSLLVSLLTLAVVAYNRWYLGGRGQSFGRSSSNSSWWRSRQVSRSARSTRSCATSRTSSTASSATSAGCSRCGTRNVRPSRTR